MKNILKNRTALSTVVTTLIILVVSVLLAGVVTYFAINITSTRVQEESLNLTHQHIWYSTATGEGAEAAIMVVNTGGRDVVFDKITVRGQTVDWANVFYNITSTAVTNDLPYNATFLTSSATSGFNQQLGGSSGTVYTLTNAGTNSITLKSGNTMLLYIKSPDSISVNDVGLTVSISIFSSQATYYKETNVEAVAS